MFARFQIQAVARSLAAAGIRGEVHGWTRETARLETTVPNGRRVTVTQGGRGASESTRFSTVLTRYPPDMSRHDPKPPTKPEGIDPMRLDVPTRDMMRNLQSAFESLPRCSGILVSAPPPTTRYEPPVPRRTDGSAPSDMRPETLLDMPHLSLVLHARDLPPEMLRLGHDAVVAVAERIDVAR